MSMQTNTNQATEVASISRTGYSFNTVFLPTGTVEELQDLLDKKIAPNLEAYENSPLVIDVSKVNYLNNLDFKGLQAVCRKYGLFLIGVSGAHTEERVKTLALMDIPVVNSTKFARIREENFKPRVITKTVEVQVPVHIKEPFEVKVPYEVKVSEPVMVLNRHVRGGEIIQAPDTSVIIFGNVSPMARIIASHNILVFGDMSGEVYAGSPKYKDTEGFKDAFIYIAGEFSPTLVAIAGQYQTAEDMDNNLALTTIYGRHGQVKVTLQGRSLNYTPLHNY